MVAETDFQNRFRAFCKNKKILLILFQKGWSAKTSGKKSYSVMDSPFKVKCIELGHFKIRYSKYKYASQNL